MRHRAVNSESYETVERRCMARYGKSFLETIAELLLARGLTVSATARELEIERDKLYTYARANGVQINVRNEVRLIDLASAQLERDIAEAAGAPAGSPMAEWAVMASETLARRRALFGYGEQPATGTDG